MLARVKYPAACRGGGGPQCRNAQGFLCFGPFRSDFSALCLRDRTIRCPSPQNESQAAPWVTFRCVLRPPSPTQGGHFPFPATREAKREATKAWQAWPGNQTSPRCLVRSLVSLAGCFAHLHASRPCPLRPWVGAISVRGASVRTRRYPQGCLAQGPTPKKRSGKKSPSNSSAPCQRKVFQNDGFRACRGR